MDQKNKYKTLVNNTFLISVGTFGSKILTFLMVRFYTGILSPSDYGTADLIMQTVNLLFPLISFGITDGVFRFALEYPRERKDIFTVGFYVITGGGLLFLLIGPLLSLAPTFRGYILLIVFFTMASCYHSLCSQFVRAEGKTALFAGQGLLNTALVIGLNILFLVVFRWGITGYILSVALADLLCAIYLVLREKLWTQLVRRPERSAYRRMLRYSIPLIPTTVLWWITGVSDRYMVTAFLGSDANGLYAVAYKIPTVLTMISGVFLEAWQFSAVSEARGSRQDHIQFYSQIWSSFQGVMFLMGSFVIAFARLGIRLLTTPEYYSSWQYVPVLAMAMVFAAFVSFMGSTYMVAKKSSLSLWTAVAGAVANVLLNWILIPRIGIQGAAIATLACYVLSLAIRAVSARKLIPFQMYTGRLLASSLIIAVQTYFALRALPYWQVAQGLCLVSLLILHRTSISAIVGMVRMVLGRFGSRKKG